ncbi:MAG: hypothetical protein MJ137_08060 [Clostridia bacterium]|nr:hypothetical protein [Clostridia bacterium]
MSADRYIIRIWSRGSIAEDFRLPKVSGYEISSPGEIAVAPENVPAEIALNCAGISYMTELSAEPCPPAPILKRLFEFAEKSSDGGAAEFFPPDSGEKKTVFAGKTVAFGKMTRYSPELFLTLRFPPVSPADFDGTGFTELLNECLPFAVPEKYGMSAPPEFDYASNGGKQGFADFLKGGGFPVIYCREPVTHMFISLPDAGDGIKTGCLTLRMNAEVWEHDNWRYALKRLLRRLACVLDAFFGQIFIGERPMAEVVWKGIPLELGEACVIGGAYPELIPGCRPGDNSGPGGQNAGRPCSPDGDGFASGSGAASVFYYEEPYGPLIPAELLSVRRKTLFGKNRGQGRGYPLPDDFASAGTVPSECFASGKKNDDNDS